MPTRAADTSRIQHRGFPAITAFVYAAVLVAASISWGSAEAQEKPEETRDCETCPTLVKTPLGYFGKFPITRGEYRAFAEATKLEADGCVLRGEKKRADGQGRELDETRLRTGR